MDEHAARPCIGDYAVIGDTHTVALVHRTGSIDWLCQPRFDAGACFAALLGTRDHGRWLIAPAIDVTETHRRYLGDTAILETEFHTASGTVRVTDLMPIRDRVPDVVRIVEGVQGEVPMQMELIVRFDYGSIVPWVRTIDGVLRAVGGPDALALWSPVPMHGVDFTTRAEFVVRAGEKYPFHLIWHPSNQPLPDREDPFDVLENTRQWWAEWGDQCTYDGPWRDAVVRSLITLKLLTYAPTGGILAAATTSLPEWPGSVRNWDYRFCWIRDATFTLYALMGSGYTAEAEAWRDWLLRAVAGDPTKLQIVYGLAGERRLTEMTLDWLPGFVGSRPVRIGNGAVEQQQHDIYGEMIDAMYLARRAGIQPDPNAWAVEKAVLHVLEERWREPDEGIWEVRCPRRHFTHSKVMAWVAFDRAVKSVEQFGLEGPVERWRELRKAICADVCQHGVDPKRGCFTQYYGSDELDASLLMVPLVGFLPIDDPRVVATIGAVERELRSDGFVRRYRTRAGGEVDGLPPGEGAFLLCSFWLADCYALQGRTREARDVFERLLSVRNDLGLLAEEYDPAAGQLLGNFPQAFSHVSLINTARNLTPQTSGPAKDRRGTDTEA
jgi:GH15 family glucan-1,4-alpha-glucosidase